MYKKTYFQPFPDMFLNANNILVECDQRIVQGNVVRLMTFYMLLPMLAQALHQLVNASQADDILLS
ncbi:uncharacterized protein LY79DRAFT_34354 [Colletotrichum navitas]|uniref:Uncharacterized protein n=1 Tax=Colletotrichum navitas TaxID=681940 RepID=A0AAD8Q7X0_9PEZI|nr:uncharacterized protein LY79DRAFT_34354 [Colletotrichum navitas]KAK1596876.1 hypothetical protein LY79DRAFT_34354 [Colletotrichum navitas]